MQLASAGKDLTVELTPLGTFHTGSFDEGASEIAAYDPLSERVFVVNAQAVTVDILDISNPASPELVDTIDASALGGSANSVDIHDGIVAVAIENFTKQAPGLVAFFDAGDGTLISSVIVGALPDMLTFTPNGQRVLVANEGEPLDYCTDGIESDPEGSVSIIDLRDGVQNIDQNDVTTADFTAFNGALLDSSIRIYGPNATISQDIEPEYIAISQDSRTAWITLQENNAIAILDISAGEITDLIGLGFKDHDTDGNGIDASDKDGVVNITSWPVKGMYEPDGISWFKSHGKGYLVTANEGDTRDYDCFGEEERVKDLTLDPTIFPDAAMLQNDTNLGRLTVTTANGDTDGDRDFDELYVPGARSFSIWDESGSLIFDSGNDLEQITAAVNPDFFNANNDDNSPDTFDSRSDNKGPEPEGVAIGHIHGKTLAFIVLERIGGIVVYDISDASSPLFLEYFNNRDFSADAESPEAGDLGPEGVLFIKQDDSPNGSPMLVVANEVSGTATVYQINIS